MQMATLGRSTSHPRPAGVAGLGRRVEHNARLIEPGNRSAFSLIELLVCVAIVAALAAIMLPSLALVKRAANQIKCGSSQRQVAMAIFAYSDDWEGLLVRCKTPVPGTGGGQWLHWFETIYPYFEAKTINEVPVLWDCSWVRTKTKYRLSYGMNIWPLSPSLNSSNFLDGGAPYSYSGAGTWAVDMRLYQITHRSKRYMIGDSNNWHMEWPSLSIADRTMHKSGAVYTYFDGHVKSTAYSSSIDKFNLWGLRDPGVSQWDP